MLKCDDFIEIGKLWYVEIYKKQMCAALNKSALLFLKNLNEYFEDKHVPELRFRRSFYRYANTDLLVYHKGKALTYTKMRDALAGDMEATKWILDFCDGNRDVTDFSGYAISAKNKDMAQAFVAIVFIAEYARGYTHALEYIYNFLIDVVKGKTRWLYLTDYFSPALTSRQDDQTEWEAQSNDTWDNDDFLA